MASLRSTVEGIILGACLLEASAFGRVSSMLESCHFTNANLVVWEAMVAVNEAKKPIDLLTVSKQLSTLEYASNDFNVMSYTASLMNRVASTANLEYHALILIELYLKEELAKLAFIYKRGLIMQNAEMAEVMGELYQALLNPLADPLEILFGTITYLRINFPTESELYQSILDLDNEFNATALKVRKQLGTKATTPITAKPAVMNNEPEHWPTVKTKAKEIAKEAERKMQLEVQESLYFDLNA
jgi:hypothetical protein